MPNVELPQAELKIVLLGDTNTGKTSLVLRFISGTYKLDSRSAPTVGAFFLTKRLTVENNPSNSNSHIALQTNGMPKSHNPSLPYLPPTTCKLLLWDTAGQVQFQKLAKTYYSNASAAILTFDVTQPTSLTRLRHWLDELHRYTNSSTNSHNSNAAFGSVQATLNSSATALTPSSTTPAVASIAAHGGVGGSRNPGDVGPSNSASAAALVTEHHPQRRSNSSYSDTSPANAMVICICACKCDLPAAPGLMEEARRLAHSVSALYMETSAKDNANVSQLFNDTALRVLTKPAASSFAAATASTSLHAPESSPVVVSSGRLESSTAMSTPRNSNTTIRTPAASASGPYTSSSPAFGNNSSMATSASASTLSTPIANVSNNGRMTTIPLNGSSLKQTSNAAEGSTRRLSPPPTNSAKDGALASFPRTSTPETEAGSSNEGGPLPLKQQQQQHTEDCIVDRSAEGGSTSANSASTKPTSNVMCEGSLLVCGTDDKSCTIM